MIKNNLRTSLLKQGQLLSKNFIKHSDEKIQKTAINFLDLKTNKNILLYFPYKYEVKLDLITLEINKHSNNIYMPRIFLENKMKFNLLSKLNDLKKNKYGIKEVINDDYINPLDIDIMIVPLVGVDCNGFRLGYGGGYFDRALSKVHSSNKKPLIVGLGYDYQICSESFGRNHDIKYDVVITETRILYFD